jgi:hypothetical protein
MHSDTHLLRVLLCSLGTTLAVPAFATPNAPAPNPTLLARQQGAAQTTTARDIARTDNKELAKSQHEGARTAAAQPIAPAPSAIELTRARLSAKPTIVTTERIDWPAQLVHRLSAIPSNQLIRLSISWSPTTRISTAFYSTVHVDQDAIAYVKGQAEHLGAHVELKGGRVELTGPRSAVERAQYVVTGRYGRYLSDARSFNGGYIYGGPVLTTFASW